MRFAIKCIRKDNGETYYAYSGVLASQRADLTWGTREAAQSEADACTKQWGDRYTYIVEPREEKQV